MDTASNTAPCYHCHRDLPYPWVTQCRSGSGTETRTYCANCGHELYGLVSRVARMAAPTIDGVRVLESVPLTEKHTMSYTEDELQVLKMEEQVKARWPHLKHRLNKIARLQKQWLRSHGVSSEGL